MKNSKILLAIIVVLSICNFGNNAQSQMMANSSFGEGYVNKLQIIIRQPDEPLMVFAAGELQRYVRQLFGFQPSLFRGETDRDVATTILLGWEVDESLSEQGYVIRRIQHHSKPDVVMITTVEDDNVGFLPQLVTPSLHKTVGKMREYGIQGFCFRQFDIAQHEPAMAYMIESAWDAAITPDDSYRRYALGVAGEKAVDDLLAAFHGVEGLTEVSNAMLGVAFLWPDIYRKYWEPGIKPDLAWQEYVAKLRPIEARLQAALSKSAPKGKCLVENYLNFIVFARQYVQALDLIRQARAVYDDAREKRKTEDDFVYNPLIRRASDLLF